MKFKDLPPHVRKIAEERAEEYGNIPTDETELDEAFGFFGTPEKEAWIYAERGNFSYFDNLKPLK